MSDEQMAKFAGRWYARIDPTSLEPGDIVEYSTVTLVEKHDVKVVNQDKPGERRCHRVEKVRAATKKVPAGFKPQLHDCEKPSRRFFELSSIIRAWRRHAR